MTQENTSSAQSSDAKTRLLESARDMIRQKGFAATSINDLCEAAGVTKGAFFHYFKSKEALGVAAAEFWSSTTGELFAAAPYHQPDDPLERVLGYLEFRRAIIGGESFEYTCLVGTMVQELHDTSPAIRDACAASIFGHAATLQQDIRLAMQAREIAAEWTPESLARHTQAVLQGAFILAKASDDPEIARESVDHLIRYIRALFSAPLDTIDRIHPPHTKGENYDKS